MPRQFFARFAAVFALALAAAPPTLALPEVKVGTGFLISPTDATTYYNAQGMTSPAWSEDPEINKLAAALGDDADRIYEYVRNEIDVIPLFGVHAGARGCYIDKACTPFDQAEFMVELLRSAGYTAKYQLGTITLTGAQFNDWFGITNATAARRLLADGGTPATVSDNGSTVTSVTMMHVWVIATIGGTPYAFDPAFKPHTAVTGIDLGAVMNFNASTFWSNAIAGATTSGDSVHSLNRANVRADVANYALTLLTHIKNNMPSAAIEDVIGGRTLVAYTGAALRQAALPHQASTTQQFTGDLPNSLRSRVSFAFGSGAQAQTLTWNLSDIYGKQLVSEANDDNPQGGTAHYRFLLGEQDISGWLDGAVTGGTVTMNHPYASGTSSGVVNGTYMDRQVVAGGGVPYGAIQIFIASGGVSNEFSAYQERTHSGRGGRIIFHKACCPEPPADVWFVPQQIAQKRRLGAAFLSQFTDMTELVGGVGNAIVLVHDVIGATGGAWTMSSDQEGPIDSSYALSMEPSISAISKTGDTAQTQTIARTVAMMASGLEGSAAQQVMDSVYPVSAVAQLDWAHAGPSTGNRWYYYATPSNWVSSIKSQILLDYGITPQETGRSPILGVAENYINAGWNVVIPKSSSLGPAPATRQHCLPWNEVISSMPYQEIHHFCIVVGPDRAGALIAFNPTTGAIAHISARDNVFGKGGGGSSDVETNPTKVFSIAEDFLDKQFSSRAAAHSVDLKSGAMTYTPPPDIKVGSGEYPYSLSFQRSYRYGFNADEDHYSLQHDLDIQAPQKTWARDPLFGSSGWTSNLHHFASISSDGAQVFGRDDPRLAAPPIATVKALLSIMGNGANNLETLERQIVGAYATFWWTQSIETNTLTIKQAHSSRTFTRLADGTYVARGSAETAIVQGARYPVTTAILAKRGGESVWWYSMCATVTGAQREITVYNGASCNQTPPTFISDYPNETRGGTMAFVSQTFPFGVTVSYNAATGRLSNNLGRWIQMNGVFGSNINGPTSYGTGGTVTNSANALAVTFVQPQGNEGPQNLSITDLAGNTWAYAEDMARTSFEVRPPSTPSLYWLRYEYAAGTFGVVEKIKDAIGNTTTYNLGGGRAASVVDPLGNTTRTMHDRFGNVVRVVDPLGRTATTEYDNYRRKVKMTAPEGNFTTYTYDTRSNVLTETQHVKPGSGAMPASRVASTKTYDALCNIPLTDMNAAGNTTTTAINQTTCKVTSVTQPPVPEGSPVTTYTYNNLGQVLTKTDPTGLVTQMTYDPANGNVTSVNVNPTGFAITTLFGYDAIGNITSVTDPRGYQHTGTYDGMRRLTQYTAPSGTNAVTKWTYDVDGLVTKIERSANAANTVWATTQYAYYATGRVASMTDADGRVTRYTYDAGNRLVFTIDPVARQTKKIYDAASQVIEERRGVGTANEQAYSKFAYTLNGKQAWIKDAKDNQTTYTYDGYDRLEKTTFPDATYEQLAYTIMDKVASKLTRGNQLIQNTYDALDREVTHLVPQPGAAPAILTTTTYDLASRVTGKSDNTGHSLAYGFDTAKRPTSVTQSAPTFAGTRVVSYLLDLAGNKTRTTWADGYYVTYAYDALNRMTTATENGTFLLSTYIYDTLSRRTSLVYGNGAAQGYTYSTQGDLLTLASTLTGTSNTTTNTFSPAHQLASEATSNAAWAYVPAAFQTTNYSAANTLNQYVNITVGANPTQTMAYDANGNLTGDGVWTFAYDAQNMLRSSASAGGTSTYQYDPLGRRQMLTEGATTTTTTFLHDGDEEIADYAAATVLRRYVPGPGTDMPIAMVTPSGGSNVRKYFHTNRQGSTIAMSADDGTMAEGPYTYDAYGNGAPATGVPFKYTGRRLDAGTGLYYYRARYYSAALGKFLQVDPVGYGDQMNLYGYVGNDPLNAVDPTGLEESVILKLSPPAPTPTQQMVEGALSCGFVCTMAGGPVPIRDGAGNTMGMYRHEALRDGLGFTASVFGATTPAGGTGDFLASPGPISLGVAVLGVMPGGKAAAGPVHHIASDKAIKSGFTAAFEKIFAKAGMTLQDSANKVALPGHFGPHSREYHQKVLDTLNQAVDGLSGKEYKDALNGALDGLKQDLLKNPGMTQAK